MKIIHLTCIHPNSLFYFLLHTLIFQTSSSCLILRWSVPPMARLFTACRPTSARRALTWQWLDTTHCKDGILHTGLVLLWRCFERCCSCGFFSNLPGQTRHLIDTMTGYEVKLYAGLLETDGILWLTGAPVLMELCCLLPPTGAELWGGLEAADYSHGHEWRLWLLQRQGLPLSLIFPLTRPQ